jgi:hypothetical protein
MVSVQRAVRERGREREKAAQYRIKNVAVCLNGECSESGDGEVEGEREKAAQYRI